MLAHTCSALLSPLTLALAVRDAYKLKSDRHGADLEKVIFAQFDYSLDDVKSLEIERAESALKIREKLMGEAIAEEYVIF